MADSYIGEIRAFAFTYAPLNWAPCDGALLPISRYPALFSVLGTTYGGDGKTTFALPDLRGCVVSGPVNQQLNDARGSATVTLLSTEMPAHNHNIFIDNGRPASSDPTGKMVSHLALPNNQNYLATTTSPAPVMTTLSPNTVGIAGAGQGHPNCQPYQAQLFCISLTGVFPPHQ